MIPLYKPFMPEVPLVNEILHSGQLAYGKYGREFEKALSDYFENPNVIVTNTFNMAILVALTTLGLKPGDTVIASPMACLASTQPLISVGLKVKWADVNPESGTLCPDSVREKMKFKPKAIIHNHFCGYVGFIDEINSIGQEVGIPVIDDGIEAFGSEYKGQKIGNTSTDATVFSFNPVRMPNTIDGGAVIFKYSQDYQKARIIRDAGIDRKQFRDEWGEINPACDIKTIGHSAGINEVSSYIGVRQMNHVKDLIDTQRKNGNLWAKVIENYDDLKPIPIRNTYPNYWVFGTLTKNKFDTLKLFREKGFFASGVHLNNNIYSVFEDKSLLPGVKEFNNNFLALPCGWWVKPEQINNPKLK